MCHDRESNNTFAECKVNAQTISATTLAHCAIAQLPKLKIRQNIVGVCRSYSAEISQENFFDKNVSLFYQDLLFSCVLLLAAKHIT